MNHFWKNDFLSIEPALPLPGVGELGTLPIAPPLAETPWRGGVLGLTGRGRDFLRDRGKLLESLGERVAMEESAGEKGTEGGPGPGDQTLTPPLASARQKGDM